MNAALKDLKFDSAGLIPAIIQDDATGEVLMMAYMNAESIKQTIETRKTHFWSRSRREPWMKGQTSGHIQEVTSIWTDCDRDTLLVKVKQTGGACHKGFYSCFSWQLEDKGLVEKGKKVFDPQDVYGKA